jgi:hypothetical protein
MLLPLGRRPSVSWCDEPLPVAAFDAATKCQTVSGKSATERDQDPGLIVGEEAFRYPITRMPGAARAPAPSRRASKSRDRAVSWGYPSSRGS